MENLSQYIKYVKLDEEKRILVSVENQFEAYLQDDSIKGTLKKSTQDILKDDFKVMEIGKNVCRITVKEGTEEKSLELIKTELVKGIEMVMAFFSQMGDMNNK